jgi:hypothetical protein
LITWLLLAAGILVAASILAAWMWHPEKNIPRDGFAHWIESLMRYYEDSAYLQITSTSSPVAMRFLRAGTKGDGCQLQFEIISGPLSSAHLSELLVELRKRGSAADLAGDEGVQEGQPLVLAEVEVPNIWSIGASNNAARLAHAALDVMELGHSERFNLVFHGRRSRSRTLEAPKRLDPRSLVE